MKFDVTTFQVFVFSGYVPDAVNVIRLVSHLLLPSPIGVMEP